MAPLLKIRPKKFFHDRKINLDYANVTEDTNGKRCIRIHFGTSEMPLFTQYNNTLKEGIPYVFTDNKKEKFLPRRIPPKDALEGFDKRIWKS
jgi:hypothetical protein